MTIRISHALLALAFFGACQGEDLSVGGGEDLEREDVEDIPAGDATDLDVSGAYLFTAFDQRACSCSAGNESELCATTLAAEGIVLTQDGGALELRPLDMTEAGDDLVLNGGIDGDGTLLVGGVNTVTDASGDPIGDTVNRVEGNIQPGDGGSLQWTLRSRAVLEGSSVDCSMVFDLTVSWWDPDTLGSCGGPFDCHPDRPYCVDEVCTDGSVGSACTFGSDCASGICVDDVCGAGEQGDPCTFPSDCQSEACVDGSCSAPEDCNATGCDAGQRCFEGACQDGAEGDPCDGPGDCAVGNACIENTCYDGSEGDPCGGAIDCNGDTQICFQGACQDGSEGDPCEDIAQCSTDAPICVDAVCYDGSAGDPCESPIDCDGIAGLECLPEGVCG